LIACNDEGFFSVKAMTERAKRNSLQWEEVPREEPFTPWLNALEDPYEAVMDV